MNGDGFVEAEPMLERLDKKIECEAKDLRGFLQEKERQQAIMEAAREVISRRNKNTIL